VKKYLIIIFVLLLNLELSSAYEGGTQDTFVPDVETQELENSVKYIHHKSEYDGYNVYSEGLKTCAAKNKYYMPLNSGIDADGCYDVLGYLDSLTVEGKETSYAGYVSTASADIKTAGVLGERQFAADYMCNDYKVGSRAMRYDDIKYLERDDDLGAASTTYLLFDAVLGYDPTGQTYGNTHFNINLGSNFDCSDFSSNLGTNESVRLDPASGGINYKSVACSSAARIICVYD